MIYDISQPVFGCSVYPGDTVPEKQTLHSMEKGEAYHLTAFSMCAHNGTHVDAPFHFLADGKTVESLDPEKMLGPSWVVTHQGEVTAADAAGMLESARCSCPGAEKRLLLRGEATVTVEAAQVFADAGLFLVGNESQSVGPLNAPMAVHLILLKKEVVLLEGIRLSAVPDGAYFLSCLPLNLNGAEGAPCRAVLWDLPGGIRILRATAANFFPDSLERFDRFQSVTDVYKAVNGELVTAHTPFSETWSPERLREKTADILSGRYMTFCACDADRVVGIIMLVPELNRGRMIVSSLHVSREHRGQGIGRMLMNTAKRFAGGRGARALYLSACSAVETIRFYRAMGFALSADPIRVMAEDEPRDLQLECPLDD